VIGAPSGTPGTRSSAGIVYVVFGINAARGSISNIDLASSSFTSSGTGFKVG